MASAMTRADRFEDRRVPPSELGPMLKTARARVGLGFRQAARAAHISTGLLYGLEAGTRCPSAVTAAGLRRVLDLRPDESAILEAATVFDAGHSYPARLAA